MTQSEQMTNGEKRMLFFEEVGLLVEEKKTFLRWEVGKILKHHFGDL